MREKVGKSRNTVFFQWFVAPEGRRVGSLKRRVRSQLARWEMTNCTPLWREAHFEVKMYKTLQRRTTFGSWDVKKVHAVVARSTFRSQNVQSTSASDHFWKLRCQKSARCCGAKHISKSKCTKHFSLGPLLEVEMSKKCTPLWREARFEVKTYKAHQLRSTFKVEMSKKCSCCGAKHISKWKCTKHNMFAPLLEVQMSFCVAGGKDCAPCQKWAKREGFVAFPETMAGVGHLKRIFKDAFAWQVQYKRHVHQRCSEVRALISWEGLHFGVSDLQVCWDDFAWQVQHFVWPGINFSWQAQYFTQVEWKNRKTHWHEAPSAALNFPFLKEVSQNCFVFDVVKFKHWGSLAELLRFWTLLGWKIKEVSQNCFVFDVVKFEKWEVSQKSFVFNLADRQIDRQTEIDR